MRHHNRIRDRSRPVPVAPTSRGSRARAPGRSHVVKVRERMTPAPIVCRTDESLDAVARRMWETELRALPVVDARGALAGMLTDRDLAMTALRRRAKLDDVR